MAKISRTEILQDFRTRSLLEATRKLIAARGFDGVTMERVAAEAGITKGAVYLYFQNKDQLILSSIEEIASEMLQEIESRKEPQASPWAGICGVVRAQLEIMERHKDFLRVLLLDRRLLSDSPRGKKSGRLLKFRSQHESRLKEILDDGLKQKTFPPMDSARAAFYINEMTISTAYKRMLGLSQVPLEDDAEGLIRFLALLLTQNKNHKHRQW